MREQPGECDLSRGRVLALRNIAEQVDQCLVRLESLRRKARQRAAEIGAVEFRVFVNLASQEALSKRAIRHKADAKLLKGRDHLGFGFAPPQRIFALERGDRLDRVGTSDRLHARFG